ncbi:hypothetical protein ACOME3_006948 [Neoechinorhynchus agilis]
MNHCLLSINPEINSNNIRSTWKQLVDSDPALSDELLASKLMKNPNAEYRLEQRASEILNELNNSGISHVSCPTPNSQSLVGISEEAPLVISVDSDESVEIKDERDIIFLD